MNRTSLLGPALPSPLRLAGATDGGNDDGRQPADTAEATRSRAPSLRVLVVEDLPRVQNLLRELIDDPGRIEVAGMVETESDAVSQFERLQPDAVVIDLNLREGTGLGVLMALRRKESTERAPRPMLIVLTNHALPVLRTACLNAGADHFLDKSHEFHKVRGLLEQAWLETRPVAAAAQGPPTH